jgi:hypothetical protein
MAMLSVNPTEVHVRCDWFDGRPLAVRLGADDIPVVAIRRVRHEAAAYPRATGPRTSFDIETDAASMRVVYRHRERRWFIECLDPAAPGTTHVA